MGADRPAGQAGLAGLTAFAWLATQKGRRIVEIKMADETSALMFRVWEPSTWRDWMPYGAVIGAEIEQE